MRLKPSASLPRRYREWLLLDMLAAIAGVAGGLGAIVFRLMIGLNQWLFYQVLLPAIPLNSGPLHLGLVLLPVIGGLIVGPVVTAVAPETKGHGVPEVMEAVALRGGKIRKRVAFVKVLVSSVTIGSGGSAGREGPIAQIGASIGSLLGDLFKLTREERRLLVVCGLSAGIAGTFNAPLGGALFGMEVLYRRVGVLNAVPVIFASVIGAAVASAYLGTAPAFEASGLTFTNPAELVLYLAFGLLFGLISVAWVRLFYAVEDLFDRLSIPDQVKPAVGASVAGLLGALFPLYGIMGVGYEGINRALAGELALDMLVTLGVAKMVATAFTVGSGGSGGIFAPSLYIGAMLGGAVGLVFRQMFPSLVQKPFTYSLAGMAALFAGAAQAPLNVIVMIPEMSNDYSLIPPLMVSSISSFIVARLLLRGSSIYTLKLERRGVQIRVGQEIVLEHVKVEEVMSRRVVTVSANMTLAELEELMEETCHHGFPVVENGRLVGMVAFRDLAKVPPELRGRLRVKDIIKRRPVVAYPDESVEAALERMYEEGVGRLPVVDRRDEGRVVGIITKSDILRAYRVALARCSED